MLVLASLRAPAASRTVLTLLLLYRTTCRPSRGGALDMASACIEAMRTRVRSELNSCNIFSCRLCVEMTGELPSAVVRWFPDLNPQSFSSSALRLQ